MSLPKFSWEISWTGYFITGKLTNSLSGIYLLKKCIISLLLYKFTSVPLELRVLSSRSVGRESTEAGSCIVLFWRAKTVNVVLLRVGTILCEVHGIGINVVESISERKPAPIGGALWGEGGGNAIADFFGWVESTDWYSLSWSCDAVIPVHSRSSSSSSNQRSSVLKMVISLSIIKYFWRQINRSFIWKIWRMDWINGSDGWKVNEMDEWILKN